MNHNPKRRQATRCAILVVTVALAACAPATPPPTVVPSPSEEEYCIDEQSGAQLSYAQALEIAQDSPCTQEGALGDTHFCNRNTGTWWIDMEVDMPGCAPACVIDVVERSAEINWRCTGLLPPEQVTTQSEADRVINPDVSPSHLAELVDGNSAFAFDLYQAIRSGDGNLFFSPFSISMALAMTYAGARSQTAAEMADTLRFTLPEERLHSAFNGLDLILAQRSQEASPTEDEGFRLHIVNALWGQQGYSFLDSFLDLLAEQYGAGMRLVDYIAAPEEARATINEWVSDQTEERITDLLPQGVIDEMTRLVLTNAIYFNASWLHPFMEELTADGAFYLLDGSKATVPMMRQSSAFGHVARAGYQAVELPYMGGDLSMVILLPDSGEFEANEARLDAQWVSQVMDGMEVRQVALTMPRFEFDADLGLADVLASMGMPTAFGESADFSGMTGARELFITDVIHKAFVSVDEAGTEAAAATAVVVGKLGMPEEPLEVIIDRPFVFLIRDIPTGTVLFVGRVVDPSAS